MQNTQVMAGWKHEMIIYISFISYYIYTYKVYTSYNIDKLIN